jgi:hypothetical protein
VTLERSVLTGGPAVQQSFRYRCQRAPIARYYRGKGDAAESVSLCIPSALSNHSPHSICTLSEGARLDASVDTEASAKEVAHTSAEFTTMRHLAKRFRGLLHGGMVEKLDDWISGACPALEDDACAACRGDIQCRTDAKSATRKTGGIFHAHLRTMSTLVSVNEFIV